MATKVYAAESLLATNLSEEENNVVTHKFQEKKEKVYQLLAVKVQVPMHSKSCTASIKTLTGSMKDQ
jgi:hypothetical protein